MIVDSHLHLWDLSSDGYGWLRAQPAALRRTFVPEEAARELVTAGVDRAVLVQAADSEADTRSMLDVAARFPFVTGVVGWLRLDDPEVAERQLDSYGDDPVLCGVRHLVHDDPRDDFLELPEVRRSLGLVAARGLAFDVPDAWPRHLGSLPALADALPTLTVVVDHLGKPPRGSEDLVAWGSALRQVALRPNTVAKVSGLQVPGQPYTTEALRPVWEVALETFGPERLMYGGDWPMTVPSGGYQAHWAVLRALADGLAPAERARLLGGTAVDAYRLQDVR